MTRRNRFARLRPSLCRGGGGKTEGHMILLQYINSRSGKQHKTPAGKIPQAFMVSTLYRIMQIRPLQPSLMIFSTVSPILRRALSGMR